MTDLFDSQDIGTPARPTRIPTIVSPFDRPGGGGSSPVPVPASGGLSLARPILNTTARANPLQLIPNPVGQALRVGQSAPAPQVFPGLPDATTALSNKWSDPDVIAAVSTLDDPSRQALIDLDAQRVNSGGNPMTRQETINAAQAITTGTPTTAASTGSPLNIPGNLLSNLGDMVKSIPRIPAALIKEVTSLGQIDDTYGDNQIANLLNSPGFRMIPGAYVAQGLARGGEGVRELAMNPLFTALDLLPGASKLAEATDVVKVAKEAAEATGATIRPLGTLATRTLDEAGNLTPNMLGRSIDTIRNDTRIGQAMDSAFGKRARDLARTQIAGEERVAALAKGLIDDGTPETLLARRSLDMIRRAEELGWDESYRVDLTKRATSGDPAALNNLGAEELAWIHDARDIAHEYGTLNTSADALAQIIDPVSGRAEFYPADQVRKFEARRTKADHLEAVSNLRDQYMMPPDVLANTPLTGDTLLKELNTSYDPRFTKKQRQVHTKAITALLEAHGYDGKAFLKTLNANNLSDAATLQAHLDTFTPATLLPLDEVLNRTSTWRNADGTPDPQVRDLARALADKNVPRINQALSNLRSRTRFATPVSDVAFADTVRSLQRRYQLDTDITRAGSYSAKDATKARQAFDTSLAKTPPARFGPMIAERTDTLTTTRATSAVEQVVGRKLSPDEAGRVAGAVEIKNWQALDDLGVSSQQLRKIYSDTQSEIARTWQELSAAGADPVFLHNVSLNRARGLSNAKIGPVANSLSQVKDRALDMSPGVQDLGVSLTHQGMEILTRRASEDFIDHIATTYGKKQSDLVSMYEAEARDLATANPSLSVQGHLQRLIDRSWEKFDPDASGYSWGGSRLNKYREDTHFIPKALAKNLKSMNDPAKPFTAALNKVTNTFRIAVVGLSPRTQLYNILGGATMVMGETGPGVFKYAAEARAMVKNPETITNELLRATIGSAKRDILEGGMLRAPQVQAQVLAGRTLGRMWEDVQKARSTGRVKDLFGKAIDKSLDLNGFFDDTYRVMGYLYGKDKALRKGMTAEVAERAGMELTQKVMMDWTSLTPFERQTLKAVFPFYGFMNHAIRYVMRYPVDHPLRASILGSFARAEVEDSQLLPSSFLGSFFFGDTDASGNRKALNLTPINPFGDVANMMTFAGFLSATNPVLSTMFESVGLIRGEAELYPTLRYNPETGRLDGSRGNPLLMLAENIVPQTQLLTSLLGVNNSFRDRMARDPAGAVRFLASSVGLPILTRNYSIPQEVAKAEAARMKSEGSAKTAALKSGDWTQALKYPGLEADYDAVLDASPEQLAQYTPQGQDFYAALIEQAYGRQDRQASTNAEGRALRPQLDALLTSITP